MSWRYLKSLLTTQCSENKASDIFATGQGINFQSIQTAQIAKSKKNQKTEGLTRNFSKEDIQLAKKHM